MPNPGQPTVQPGDTGSHVRRLQRALRRTLDYGGGIDGDFGTVTEKSVKDFQGSAGLTVDGIVGHDTWHALPDGGPMPLLKEGSSGAVVSAMQTVLSEGAWSPGPGAIDGQFGPQTKASVEGFQSYGGVTVDGIVGDNTWGVHIGGMNATLETQTGLEYVIG